jgi:tRNA (cmo5U34)-methyltransferase
MPKSDNTSPHLASFYDNQIRSTVPFYDCFHIETINLIKATKIQPEAWLDTGCGTGSLVQKACGYFRDTRFLMTDPSQEMMNITKEKFKLNNHIKFLNPAATQDLQMEFIVDVVTAIQAHHYLSKEMRKKATQVCFDALAENGIYITFENIRPFSDNGIAISQANWADFQLSRGKDPESVKSHIQRFDTEYFPITIDEHLSLLKDCGFKTVELFWFSYMQAGFYGIK